MAPSSSSTLSLSKPYKKPSTNPNSNPNSNSSSNCLSTTSHLCNHSPSATLDLLILILVLCSGTFLISSYFSYIFRSLSLLFPYSPPSISIRDISAQIHYVFYASFFVFVLSLFELCFGVFGSRRCGKSGCKGLRKALEFDLKLQGEECLRLGNESSVVREVNELPWKGGSESNPDYECLRAELRKMAPPNGRAVLLFRSKCGCPVAKLEGWGVKRGRRNKKAPALSGKVDHR